jgi:hypothetical protein
VAEIGKGSASKLPSNPFQNIIGELQARRRRSIPMGVASNRIFVDLLRSVKASFSLQQSNRLAGRVKIDEDQTISIFFKLLGTDGQNVPVVRLLFLRILDSPCNALLQSGSIPQILKLCPVSKRRTPSKVIDIHKPAEKKGRLPLRQSLSRWKSKPLVNELDGIDC